MKTTTLSKIQNILLIMLILPLSFAKTEVVSASTDVWATILTGNYPGIRQGASWIWTGEEIIVWGGTNGTGSINTGFRYNPLSNIITPLPTAGAPSARRYHSALWTGSDMIIWGGETGNSGPTLNNGALYNPATNSWSPISSVGAPTGRYLHVAVWTGTQMIIWGGDLSSPNVVPTNTGAIYTLSTNSWSPLPVEGAPSARTLAHGVWSGSQMIVYGGAPDYNSAANFINTGAKYDPMANAWYPMSTDGAPEGLSGASAFWSGSDLIVYGGYTTSGVLVNTGRKYNSASNTWSAIPTSGAPSPRVGMSLTWTGMELFVWGGSNGTNLLGDGARYNPYENQWTPLSNIGAPSPRSDAISVWKDNHPIIWGGTNSSGVLNLDGAIYYFSMDPVVLDPGYVSPTATILDSGTWSNMPGAYHDDNVHATSSFRSLQFDRWTGYRFNIPSGAVILGVEIRIDASTYNGKGWLEVDISNGNSFSTRRHVPCCDVATAPIPASKTTFLLGGQYDRWGLDWTPENVDNLQVRVRVMDMTDEHHLWWLPAKVYYQLPAYSISGRVTDAGGNPINGAKVTTEFNHSTYSGTDGRYILTSLPSGPITIQGSYNGQTLSPPTRNVQLVSSDVLGQDFSYSPTSCVGATAMPPLFLVNGWGGSLESNDPENDENFSALYPQLANKGYLKNCNLFMAAGTSPSFNIDQNARIIKQDICDAYKKVKSVYPGWNGSFDIIAHSYGGLRTRGYLENRELYYQQCADQTPAPTVRNLITLGSPHTGDLPTLPLSSLLLVNGLGSSFFGHTNKPAILELWSGSRLAYNLSHTQLPGITYYLISGDSTTQSVPYPLSILANNNPDYLVTESDMAVHLISGLGYDLIDNLYPRTYRIKTNDVHGRSSHWIVTGLNNMVSYMNSPETLNVIEDIIEGTYQPSLSEEQMNQHKVSNAKINLVEGNLVKTPDLAQQEIAVGALIGTQVISGSFTINDSSDTMILLAWSDGIVDLLLKDPQGNYIAQDERYLKFNGGFGWQAGYSLQTPQIGTWTYIIKAQALTEPAVYRLAQLFNEPISVVGEFSDWIPNHSPLSITALVTHQSSTPISGGNISARLNRPDGTTDNLVLYDDGIHQDGQAGDGLFGATYANTDIGGLYGVMITATGTYNSSAFTRTTSGMVSVAPASISLGASYTDMGADLNANGSYDYLEIEVPVTVVTAGDYDLSAELYGGITFIAQTRVSVHLEPGTQTLKLRFDGAAISQSKLSGPYKVRNVMLFDKNDLPLLVVSHDNAYMTAPYQYYHFEPYTTIYLPAIVR